jgi:hypothetical protein
MFPAQLEDYVAEDNPVRVIDFFVDQLDLRELGFSAIDPKETGRPAYHPAVMLKIYVYGYLNLGLMPPKFNLGHGWGVPKNSLDGRETKLLRRYWDRDPRPPFS